MGVCKTHVELHEEIRSSLMSRNDPVLFPFIVFTRRVPYVTESNPQ